MIKYKKYKILYGNDLNSGNSAIINYSLHDLHNSAMFSDATNNDFFSYEISFRNLTITDIRTNGGYSQWLKVENGILKNISSSDNYLEILLRPYNVVSSTTPFDYNSNTYTSSGFYETPTFTNNTGKHVGSVSFSLKSSNGDRVYATVNFDGYTSTKVSTTSTTYEYFTVVNPSPQRLNTVSMSINAQSLSATVYLKDIYLIEATSYTERHPIPSGKTPFDKITFFVNSNLPSNNTRISYSYDDLTASTNMISSNTETTISWTGTVTNKIPDILKITLGAGDEIKGVIISGMNTYK